VLPDVPTVSEAASPATKRDLARRDGAGGNAQAVVDRLNAEIRRIVASPEVKGAWEKQGAAPMSMTPDEFARFMREDIEKWARIVKISGAKPDQ
jgi:tripartite-type tricarboxylate transporter receptor subunit TctC